MKRPRFSMRQCGMQGRRDTAHNSSSAPEILASSAPSMERTSMKSSVTLAVGLLLAASLSACSKAKTYSLTVSVNTGLVAGPEFTSVETLLLDSGDFASGLNVKRQAVTPAAFGDNYAATHQVIQMTGVDPGDQVVRVTLFKPDGSKLIARNVRFRMLGNYGLTVYLTRDCVNVTCPAPAGSATDGECLAGACVDAQCNPDDPSTELMHCGNAHFCNSANDCAATSSCATSTCNAGVCSQVAAVAPAPGACTEGSWCDPAATGGGCMMLSSNTDGGVGTTAACDTICFIDSTNCKFGVVDCTTPSAPVCSYLGNRPVGTPCGGGLACDGTGSCTDGVDSGMSSVVDSGIADSGMDAH